MTKPKSNPKVSIVKMGPNISLNVERAIVLVGGLKLNKKTKILIKPNLSFPKEASTGITTGPLIVKSICEYLLKHKANINNVLVGEYATPPFDTISVFKKIGMAEICEEIGVAYIDLSKTKFVGKDIKLHRKKLRFYISEEVINRDLVINVPVLKTHSQTGVSISLKNMKGVVNFDTRKMMHRGGLDEPIAYLNSLVTPYFTLVDGTIGLMGMGPGTLGKPANLGILLAGWDPVAVDRICCEVTELEPAPHIIISGKLGVGEKDLTKIKVVGEDINKVKKKFEPPVGKLALHPLIEIIDGKACSGCMFNVWLAAYKITKGKIGKKIEILMGPKFDINQIELGSPYLRITVGDCMNKYQKIANCYIKGCPPTIDDVTKTLNEITTRKTKT